MNIFEYVAMRQQNFEKQMSDLGHESKTTFYGDFSAADSMFHTIAETLASIEDTYKRAFKEWKGNYIYLSELVLVLNWKIWEWNEKNEDIARLYDKLWDEANNYAYENLKGDELSYFLNLID